MLPCSILADTTLGVDVKINKINVLFDAFNSIFLRIIFPNFPLEIIISENTVLPMLRTSAFTDEYFLQTKKSV